MLQSPTSQKLQKGQLKYFGEKNRYARNNRAPLDRLSKGALLLLVYAGSVYFSTLTAQDLYSGVPAMGQRCSEVKSLVSAS